MKFLIYYFFYDDIKCQIVDISCIEDILNFGKGVLNTTSNNVELVLFEDGTKVLDNEYLFSLNEFTDLLIYQKNQSENFTSLFLVKQLLLNIRYGS